MVKAEIRPPSSSSPEPAASAIKHDATERAAEPTLPITDAFPRARLWRAGISILGTPCPRHAPLASPLCPLPPAWPWARCLARGSAALGSAGHTQITAGARGDLGWVRGRFAKGNLCLCNRVSKYFHWKHPNTKHLPFSGVLEIFFHAALDPFDKAGLNVELFWDPPPQEMNT